jgi:hypothetical protein
MRVPFFLAMSVATRVMAQPLIPTLVHEFDSALNETSGLLMVDGGLWTILDSGNPHAIFRIDPASGGVTRTLTITNATNTDWEDIAADDAWVYVGDFGNNSGSRTDLRVYRVPRTALLDEGITEVIADTIRFAYADQTDFTPANNANNWDCEAFIARDDSLFLFSKNWLTSDCYLYALSATPGDHFAERRDTLLSSGLVTGASIDPTSGDIALIGYTNGTYTPFAWRLSDYAVHAFFDGVATRHAVIGLPMQAEGIAWTGMDTVYFSHEAVGPFPAELWELELVIAESIGISGQGADLRAYPNPVHDALTIESTIGRWILLKDVEGRTVIGSWIAAGRTRIDVGSLPSGAYTLHTGEGPPIRLMIAH